MRIPLSLSLSLPTTLYICAAVANSHRVTNRCRLHHHTSRYQYRICAASQPLSEECFQQTPLNFTQRSWLEFRNGSRLQITGTYLSTGTTPPNSTWALLPLPFVTGPRQIQQFGSFPPPCIGKDNRSGSTDPRPSQLCGGTFPFGVNIIDELEVPNLPSGEYVLGLRYDPEMTAQIWQQCSDISVLAESI